MTSSFSLSGDTPLCPSDFAVSTSLTTTPMASSIPSNVTSVASTANPAFTHPAMYDPQAWAYYNSHCSYIAQYNQMAMSYGSTLPATAPVTANLTPQSGVSYDTSTANAFNRTPIVGLNGATHGSNSQTVKPSETDDEDDTTVDRGANRGNQKGTPLACWGNEKSMNLNQLLLTNIQQSQYFKVTLYSLKTFSEVIDEIWYNVKHLEPWERGSRKIGGQTGMCGGVRGVGAGGIVSTAFCLLYKLHTLKPTRKQVMTMIKYKDAPNIRALGFLFIRYTQPPDQLWDWFCKYLGDKEEVDASSNGGPLIAIGDMVRNLLTKLEWYSTLFPRIPIPIQKDIERKLEEYDMERSEEQDSSRADREKQAKGRKRENDDIPSGSRGKSSRHSRERSRSREKSRSVHRESSSRRENNHSSSRSSRDHRNDRHSHRSSSRDRRRSRSPPSSNHHHHRDRAHDRRRHHR